VSQFETDRAAVPNRASEQPGSKGARMPNGETPLTRGEAMKIFERRREAWLANDAETYMSLWVDDMVIDLPGRETIRGKDAYAKVIDRSMQHMRPISWVFHHLAVDGDRVMAEWTIEGEFISKSKQVRWRGMSICRMERGLICEWREYWNPNDLEV
jgi:limonene-1,2-epoxide hydrolase